MLQLQILTSLSPSIDVELKASQMSSHQLTVNRHTKILDLFMDLPMSLHLMAQERQVYPATLMDCSLLKWILIYVGR